MCLHGTHERDRMIPHFRCAKIGDFLRLSGMPRAHPPFTSFFGDSEVDYDNLMNPRFSERSFFICPHIEK